MKRPKFPTNGEDALVMPSTTTSEGESLVRVDGVYKKFCKSLRRSLWYGLTDVIAELDPFHHRFGSQANRRNGSGLRIPGPLRPEEFWAVENVSFELKRGECLGLIGHNGAGKTTLLKMLNGLIKPDFGSIEMRGKVGALIALGAGFNPILSGRENIYVNGSVLGMSKAEIDGSIDEIIEFSGIEDFIDAPVQTYSSGMQVRLGFAVATALKPDILILDEVLAVGDSAFKFKCYKRIDSLLSSTAVIFVSHNMPDIMRLCTRTMLLGSGRVAFSGGAGEGIRSYNQMSAQGGHKTSGFVSKIHPIVDFDVTAPTKAISNDSLELQIALESAADVDDIRLIINFFNDSEQYACNAMTNGREFGVSLRKGKHIWKCRISSLPLKEADYRIAVHLVSERAFIASHSKVHSISVSGRGVGSNSDCVIILDQWEEASK